MAIWLGPSSRNPGQSTPPALRRRARLVATSTWSPPPPARQPRPSRMVSRRKVSGAPAGPVCPVVSGTRPVVVGIAPVVGTAVVPGRVVEVATVAVVGTGRWSRSRPGPARPAAAAGQEPGGQQRDRHPGAPSRQRNTSRPLHRLSAGATIVAAMMQLDAPERDVPAGAVLRLPQAALLVVAGVPGAGKTTLLSRIDAPGSLVLDPEPIRPGSSRLGPGPYRLWRPLVHAEHVLRILVALPGPPA